MAEPLILKKKTVQRYSHDYSDGLVCILLHLNALRDSLELSSSNLPFFHCAVAISSANQVVHRTNLKICLAPHTSFHHTMCQAVEPLLPYSLASFSADLVGCILLVNIRLLTAPGINCSYSTIIRADKQFFIAATSTQRPVKYIQPS